VAGDACRTGLTVPELSSPVKSVPAVYLLDASVQGWDEKELRAQARAVAAQKRAPYSSRSYRYPYALVAWHSAPVGVDLEVVEAANLALADVICTEAERRLLATVHDQASYLSRLWSAKEALAKALGDAVLYEPHRLGSPMLWLPERFSAQSRLGLITLASGRWQATSLRVPYGHVGWLCWVAVPSPSPSPGFS